MQIRLPQLGEGADSGTVVSILVKEGDQVKKDQPVIELENEKAVASIPASASGTVTKIHVKPGDKISVGQLLLTLDGGTVGGVSTEPAISAAKSSAPSSRASTRAFAAEAAEALARAEETEGPLGGSMPPAAPSVRKLARELGIDLRRVRGNEPGGRVVVADLRAYVQGLQRRAVAPEAAGPAKSAAPQVDFSKWGPVTTQPFSSVRQTIAQRMVGSWTAIPHVTQFDEAELTTLLAVKKRHEGAYEQKGAKLTVTAVVLKVLAKVLKTHPKFNASLDEVHQQLVLKQYIHLGVAVDTEAGLMVPVLRDADEKTLLEVCRELSDLVERTRQRKVSSEELQGSSFTVSNQGGIGGGPFTPIIKHPDVAILGIGQARPQAVVRDGAVAARTMMPLGLSYDHRVIDGAEAARFITDLVRAIESVTDAEVALARG